MTTAQAQAQSKPTRCPCEYCQCSNQARCSEAHNAGRGCIYCDCAPARITAKPGFYRSAQSAELDCQHYCPHTPLTTRGLVRCPSCNNWHGFRHDCTDCIMQASPNYIMTLNLPAHYKCGFPGHPDADCNNCANRPRCQCDNCPCIADDCAVNEPDGCPGCGCICQEYGCECPSCMAQHAEVCDDADCESDICKESRTLRVFVPDAPAA